MKKITSLTLVLFLMMLIGCSEKAKYGQPNIHGETLEKDFVTWWKYYKKNIVLSSDFVALDDVENPISKAGFLQKLTSGNYIPLKLNSKDSLTYYKLFKLSPSAINEVKSQMRQSATIDLVHFKAEGTTFLPFQFTDLNGTTYNNENTKGKIVILKCWFIKCHACVAEFPKLNQLVDNYQRREDMLFISLAIDPKEKLDQFLTEKKFNYRVVPEQRDFMEKELGLTMYPTHYIIDKSGVIRKVVNSADEMIPAFNALASTK